MDSSKQQQPQEDTTTTSDTMDPIALSGHSTPSVAAAPKETLYESLLRYHEDDDDDETEVEAASIATEDDRKPAAKPLPPKKPPPVADDMRVVSENSAKDLLQKKKKPPPPARSSSQGDMPPEVPHNFLKQEEDRPASLDDLPAASAPHFRSHITGDPMVEPAKSHVSADEPAPAAVEDAAYVPASLSEPVPFDESSSVDDIDSSAPTPPASSHQRITSFHKAALEASGSDEYPPPDMEHMIEDEKLAIELSRKLELQEERPPPLETSDISQIADPEQVKIMLAIQQRHSSTPPPASRSHPPTPPHPQSEISQIADPEQVKIMQAIQQQKQGTSPSGTSSPSLQQEDISQIADFEQMKIMQAIRDEEERRQLEQVLRDSSGHGHDTTAPPQVDYLLSQQLAMEEYRSTHPQTPPHVVGMEYYTSPEDAEANPEIQRGSHETRQAIANGTAHVVQCQGCLGRLHAPISYSLVYCPKCHTVSPGQPYQAEAGATNLRRGRSKRL